MNKPSKVLTLHDRHDCGKPPNIIAGDTHVLTAHWENKEGDQWAMTIDPEAKVGRLWASDLDWHSVDFSTKRPPSHLIMAESEADVLRAAWQCATGDQLQIPKGLDERMAQRIAEKFDTAGDVTITLPESMKPIDMIRALWVVVSWRLKNANEIADCPDEDLAIMINELVLEANSPKEPSTKARECNPLTVAVRGGAEEARQAASHLKQCLKCININTVHVDIGQQRWHPKISKSNEPKRSQKGE